MNIKLIKDWKKDSGFTLEKGRTVVVTQELGQQLIRQKKAVELKEHNEIVINFDNNNTEVKTPLT
jgi:molybdopterin converting factor small subunit